ncbi:MAG: peroxiredoxin [Pseudomonadota bacterium]
MTDLTRVDWSTLPKPQDDGGAAHLYGAPLPDVRLPSTGGDEVAIGALTGLSVLYAYPMTGRPGVPLPDGWDGIPGARGCTPQACAFRDHARELEALGVSALFGLSTQSTAEQKEAADRLHLPFDLLSDHALVLQKALNLPTFTVDGRVLLRRLTIIAENGVIGSVMYPVFPPDRAPEDVIDWLKKNG